MHLKPELEAAVEAARMAAVKIRSRVGQLARSEISEKGRNDLVTTADIEAQQIIVDILQSAFSQYGMMAEEDEVPADNDQDQDQWIVDPIDGTTNFVHALPPYSVSIALQRDREIVLGVVLEVDRDELFTAVKGAGCRLNGKRCFVTGETSPRNAMLATGFPTRDYTMPFLEQYLEVLGKAMNDFGSVRRMGSAAADLAYVACGRFDGFFEIGLAPWDSAAGSLLITEAGGVVTDFKKNPEFLHGPQVLASNALLHDDLVQLVEPLAVAMYLRPNQQ